MNAPSLTQTPAIGRALPQIRRREWLPLLVLALGCFVHRLAYVLGHDFDLFVDEAQYWQWAQQLEWGYFSKPPLVAWLIAASTAAFGDSEAVIRLPAMLAYPLASLAIAALAWRIGGRRAALWSAVVFLSMPGQALSGWILSPDAFLLLAWSVALWQFHRALAGHDAAWGWLGLALGVGVLAKYSMLMFLPGMALVLLQRAHRPQLRRPGPWVSLGLLLLLLAPNLLWNAQHHFGTVRHTASLAAPLSPGWWHPDKLGEFLIAQWGIFGGLALPLWGWAAWSTRKQSTSHFLLPFVLPYLAAMCLLALFANANPNWAAAAYVGASVGLGLWLAQRHWRWGAALAAANLVLALTVMHARDIPALRERLPANGQDLHERVSGWRELGAALQPIIDAHGQPVLISSERTLLAELGYYLSPRPYRLHAFDADGVPDHHFELRANGRPLPQQALWVSTQPLPAALAQQYGEVRRLPNVRIRTPLGLVREVQVVWLQGHRP